MPLIEETVFDCLEPEESVPMAPIADLAWD